MFRGVGKIFCGLWVCFFIDLKVASKNCPRLPYFTLLRVASRKFLKNFMRKQTVFKKKKNISNKEQKAPPNLPRISPKSAFYKLPQSRIIFADIG